MKLKKLNLILITLLIFNFLTLPAISLASTFDQIMFGFSATGKSGGFPQGDNGAPKTEFVPAWAKYLNGLLTLMGLVFMLLIIYGGFLWMTARGKEEQVKKGRDMIINAAIGLGIILGARIVSELVILNLPQ